MKTMTTTRRLEHLAVMVELRGAGSKDRLQQRMEVAAAVVVVVAHILGDWMDLPERLRSSRSFVVAVVVAVVDRDLDLHFEDRGYSCCCSFYFRYLVDFVFAGRFHLLGRFRVALRVS